MHGRILAVANAYARHIQQENGIDSLEALGKMRSLVDLQFDRSCYEALVASLTNTHAPQNMDHRAERLALY